MLGRAHAGQGVITINRSRVGFSSYCSGESIRRVCVYSSLFIAMIGSVNSGNVGDELTLNAHDGNFNKVGMRFFSYIVQRA